MLDRTGLEKALTRFSYKPGIYFSIEEPDPIQGVYIRIYTCQPDAQGTEDVELKIWTPIPTGIIHTESDFFNWLLDRVKQFELHEMLEWFQIEGKPIINPHTPLP